MDTSDCVSECVTAYISIQAYVKYLSLCEFELRYLYLYVSSFD